MKTFIFTLGLFSAAFVNAFAASSFQYEYSTMRDASGNPILTGGGTFAIVLDNDQNQLLPGGFTYSVGNFQNATTSNVSALANDFAGKALTVGTNIGGNLIHELKIIDNTDLGPGVVSGITVIPSDSLDNTRYAIYWFPGRNPGDILPTTGPFQVGAVVDGTILSGLRDTGFTTPPNGSEGVFSVSLFDVNAVLVPEPSSLLLSSLALTGLLIRRRSMN